MIKQYSRQDLIDLVAKLTDSEPCYYDHHGYCQQHSVDSPCPHEAAKELLSIESPSK